MTEKILIICPKFYPKRDGLSGYTTKLSLELSKYYNVDLLTSIEFQNSKVEPIGIFAIIERWTFNHLFKQSKTILKNEYQHILIQYVPTMYGSRGGINFSILLFFLYLRFFTKSKVSFMFHEIYYPFSFYWKAIILNITHKIMLTFSLFSSHIAFFSTKRFLNEAKYFTLNHKKLIHLPVGNNLYIQNDSCELPVLDNNLTKIVLFGSAHPSKNYSLIFKTLSSSYKKNPNFKLIVIGSTKESLKNEIDLPDNFDSFTEIFSNLEDEKVVSIFKQADLLLSYFIDGLTTRRSSVISALAHGLPIISTKSHYTEDIFIGQKAIQLFSTDEDSYADSLNKFLSNNSIKADNEIRRDAKKFYDQYFDWSRIGEIIIKNWD
jgi:glycosyltransferase involved in cell wall biosynthesis